MSAEELFFYTEVQTTGTGLLVGFMDCLRPILRVLNEIVFVHKYVNQLSLAQMRKVTVWVYNFRFGHNATYNIPLL